MAVATLLGSGLFVINIVFAMVIFASKGDVKITAKFIARDLMFYIFAVSLLIYALILRGYFDIWFSLALLLIYVLYPTYSIIYRYVAFVIVQNKIYLK